MFPAFTNFALLAGLAALAAPILIHLLLRRKSQRMRFSTVQFFLKQDEQSIRRRKLRNFLLLATRMLLFALLVLAFTRPFLRNQGVAADAGQRRQLVLLLDISASMQAAGPDGTQWDRAKKFAREELDKLQMNDRAALITCSTRAELVSEFAPAAGVRKQLEALEPNFGTARMEEGLRQVSKVLATANPAYKTEVCIISDLQRNGCDNIGNTPLPREVQARIIDLGDRFIPNVAVSALQIETTAESGPRAILTSLADEGYAALPYQVRVDGKEVFAGTVNLEAGGSTNIPLAIPVLAPGWHSAEFLLKTKDALKADDVAFATAYVPRPVHGLVVETKKAAQLFLEESYFVTTALNPVRGEEKLSSSRFAYEKVSLEALPVKIKSEPGQPKVEFVVLPGVKTIPAGVVSALKEHVQNGGGLMLFVGDGTSAISYAMLGELLPAQIGKSESNDEGGWRVATYDKGAPMFTVFREPNSGNLFLPEFTRRFSLKPAQGSLVVAEFENGVPLIIARQVGQGRVLLVNTSADTAWTDWQKRKTFVPWLHASTRYITRRDEAHEREAAPVFVSGTELALDLEKADELKKQTLRLQRVGGAEVTFVTDDDGVAQELLLETPGIYILRDSNGRELRRLAANLPSAESDLTSLPPAEVEQQLVYSSEVGTKTLTAGLFGDPTRGKELWRALLFAGLVFLLLEPILANRMFA